MFTDCRNARTCDVSHFKCGVMVGCQCIEFTGNDEQNDMYINHPDSGFSLCQNSRLMRKVRRNWAVSLKQTGRIQLQK